MRWILLPWGREHFIPHLPHSLQKLIDAVTSSAAQSELAAAFLNAREAVYLRNVLEAIGYPQQRTPIVTDNSFIFSVMDMRYHWLRDRVGQANLRRFLRRSPEGEKEDPHSHQGT
jgi:hypothetical protein